MSRTMLDTLSHEQTCFLPICMFVQTSKKKKLDSVGFLESLLSRCFYTGTSIPWLLPRGNTIDSPHGFYVVPVRQMRISVNWKICRQASKWSACGVTLERKPSKIKSTCETATSSRNTIAKYRKTSFSSCNNKLPTLSETPYFTTITDTEKSQWKTPIPTTLKPAFTR